MSLNLNPAYVTSHWESVEAGAARTGRKPSRQDWRLVREVFVADTDEEAWKLSTGDMMGRMMGEYFLPLLGHFGFGMEVRITRHIGWTNDLSWGVIDGPKNNFTMIRSGLNFAF